MTEPGGSLLRADGVCKEYVPGTMALHPTDLAIAPGEMVGLVGPNGAGKSTLINILGGFIKPSSGHVGKDVTRLGWCPQQTVIDWSLTAMQNVAFLARLHGFSLNEANRRAEEALRLLGLTSLARRQAETLSGGQLQRLQIARALCFDAELLILDEPTTGLDVEGQEAMWEYLRREQAKGVGMLISSHDLDALEHECDRFVVLRAGRIVMSFSSGDIAAESACLVSLVPSDSVGTQSVLALAESLGRRVDAAGGLTILESELPTNWDAPSAVQVVRKPVTLRDAYLATKGADE